MSDKKTSFYLLTDTHYVSKNNWVEGKPFNDREKSDYIALKLSPEILDTFIDKIIADTETDTVIFTGDNVNNGDMASHAEFRQRLDTLVAAGKKVYVTTATHDYCGEGDDENIFHACRYTETGTEPIDYMRKAGLFDYYKAYGPEQALSVHDESGSYSVQLGEGVRLVMINDNGNGRSHCGLFDDGHKWLREQIHEAKSAGDYILLAVHHPVLPPWETYRHLMDFEVYGGYEELKSMMCEEGVRVVFTGHTHVQNIRKYTDPQGRYFYDVSTISLVNAAGKMRKITVDADSGICEITSIGTDVIRGVDTQGLTAHEYLYTINLPGILEKLLPLSLRDFDAFLGQADGCLPVDKMRSHKALTKFALKKVQSVKMSTLAKFGRVKNELSPEELKAAKATPVIDVAYVVLRHLFPGNAPYTPDTTEFKIINAVASRLDGIVDRFNIEKVKKIIPPGSSLREIFEDFLYNNRTGDDDSITIEL
jgi:3',5'-cyclic AMP phosphodiesterase CpdA